MTSQTELDQSASHAPTANAAVASRLSKGATSKRVYIAGPMTGLPNFNYHAFFAMACELAVRGFQPVNPADVGVRADWSHTDYMHAGFRRLLTCDAVVLLEGWEGSVGASLEVDVARSCGLKVYLCLDDLVGGRDAYTWLGGEQT